MPEQRADSGEVTGSLPPAIYRASPLAGRLYQGEVLQAVRELRPHYEADRILAREQVHGLAVSLTQDCDLEQDWKARETDQAKEPDLRNVLFCPAWAADDLRDMHQILRETKFWKQVQQNKADRYHYLAPVLREADAAGEGLDPVLIDFKSYFTVATVDLYRQFLASNDPPLRRRSCLNTPWREHLQLRFMVYQARIGLPVDHFTREVPRNLLEPPIQ